MAESAKFFLTWALACWMMWAFLNVVAFCISAAVREPVMAQYDGFRITVPSWLHRVLTPRELAAVRQHEEGHRAAMHPWKNLARLCLLWPAGRETLRAQELEADDYVKDPAALASAIRKTSNNRFDLLRAHILEVRARMKGGQEARNPAPGKGAKTEEGEAPV